MGESFKRILDLSRTVTILKAETKTKPNREKEMKMTQAISDTLHSIGYDVETYTCLHHNEPMPLDDWLRATSGGKSGKRQYATLASRGVKTDKGLKDKVKTFILYMSPAKEAGVNMCPMSGNCASVCINTSGQMVMRPAIQARIKRTLRYHLYREQFMHDLTCELNIHKYTCELDGYTPAVRLNGTSDILWERTGIIDKFPELQFYDYTKFTKRQRPNVPSNYHLTYSLSEQAGSWGNAKEWLDNGGNVAVVVRNKLQARFAVAMGFQGYPAINGDKNDLRYTDPKGTAVILYAKGKATKDTSGFVQDINTQDISIAA